MANEKYDAATNAQREELKQVSIVFERAVVPSRDGGIEAGTHAPNVDVDSVGARMAAALSAVGISGNASTEATVANAAAVSVVNSAGADAHSGTATVADSALSNVKLAATVALVDNADTVPVFTSAGTAKVADGTVTVAAGVVSKVALPATATVLLNSGTVTVQTSAGTGNQTGTATVAAGVVSAVKLPATVAMVANGGTLAVTGGTVTFAVANGVLSGTYAATA